MKFKKIVPNFFTPIECEGFIAFSEKQGYEEALIRTKDRGEILNKDIRDNDRVIWDRPEVAKQLFHLVKEHLIMIDGYEPIGLNERFRFYRYQDGQRFRPHRDGAYKRSETEVSLVTLLIYLNEGFEGGSTFLIDADEEVIPKTGTLLLFDHKMLHSGTPVTKGVKYVLRTDVMYKLKKYENE